MAWRKSTLFVLKLTFLHLTLFSSFLRFNRYPTGGFCGVEALENFLDQKNVYREADMTSYRSLLFLYGIHSSIWKRRTPNATRSTQCGIFLFFFAVADIILFSAWGAEEDLRIRTTPSNSTPKIAEGRLLAAQKLENAFSPSGRPRLQPHSAILARPDEISCLNMEGSFAGSSASQRLERQSWLRRIPIVSPNAGQAMRGNTRKLTAKEQSFANDVKQVFEQRAIVSILPKTLNHEVPLRTRTYVSRTMSALPEKAGREKPVRPVPKSLAEAVEMLFSVPEEIYLHSDTKAISTLVEATKAVASMMVKSPSTQAIALAKLLPNKKPFKVVPRKAPQLGNIRLYPRRFLGEGSYGIVIKAVTQDEVEFAVKVCTQERSSRLSAAAEAKLLRDCERAELSIPVLFPRSFDPFTLFKKYRIVVPFLVGQITHMPSTFSLGKHVYGTKVCALYPAAVCDLQQLTMYVSLSPPVLLELTKQMISVVARLHLLGVVHLDIKLANFLIDSKGRVLISDFGLARRLDKPPVNISCRSGSPVYMSPEIIECVATSVSADAQIVLSRKMDAFSLGVSIFMIWCNGLPFANVPKDSDLTTVIKALHNTYKEVAQIEFPSCPGGGIPYNSVQSAVAGLLRIRPENRTTPIELVQASPLFAK